MLEKLYLSASDDTYSYFKNDLKKTFLNLSKNQIRQYSIKIAIENGVDGGLFLELGVLNGASINLFADFLEKKELKIYGFDSFQGFSSNWPGSHLQSAFFNRGGILPKVKKNAELIKGNVIDTFEKFLEEKKNINFIHLDIDFYEATTHCLKVAKKYLKKGAYILIDDFANYLGWENGTFKAINDNFLRQDYEIISFGVYRSSTILLRIIK